MPLKHRKKISFIGLRPERESDNHHIRMESIPCMYTYTVQLSIMYRDIKAHLSHLTLGISSLINMPVCLVTILDTRDSIRKWINIYDWICAIVSCCSSLWFGHISVIFYCFHSAVQVLWPNITPWNHTRANCYDTLH